MGFLFLICLCLLLTSISALFYVSRTSGIHQNFFVFRRHLDILKAATTFAPYSILPTLLGVGVKLWLSAIGDALKRLQPYVSMLDAPTPLRGSILAEYTNTPLALISAKAMRHSHFVLALVGVAALASEICKSANPKSVIIWVVVITFCF